MYFDQHGAPQCGKFQQREQTVQTIKLNNVIYQGSTPTFKMTLPEQILDSSIESLCIAFKQRLAVVFEITQATVRDGAIWFTLTQEQTKQLKAHETVKFQLKLKLNDGNVFVSYEYEEKVLETFCKTVLGEDEPTESDVDTHGFNAGSSDQQLRLDLGEFYNVTGWFAKGDWNNQTTYDTGSVVYYEGSSYVAKRENTNKVPVDNTDDWQIVALKGGGKTTVYVGGEPQIDWVADTKLDKVDEQNKIYGTNSNSQQVVLDYDYNLPTAWSIVQRNANGQVVVAIPSEDNQAAPKKYVDDAIREVEDNPDVRDIVNTKADLDSYPTTALGDNDIIRVLQDETHDGASTYYRWNKTSSQWTYVGQAGDYYTKTQADNKFVTQETRTGYRVYVHTPTGDDTVNYAQSALAGDIPQRTTNGNIAGPAADKITDDSWYVTKEYTDDKIDDINIGAYRTAAAQDVIDSGKLDKVTTADGNSRIYATDGQGGQSSRILSTVSTQYTIPYRGANGTLAVGTPTANDHATPKGYVDDGFVAKVDGYYAVYGKLGNGNEGLWSVGYSPTPNTLSIRDNDGCIKVNDPLNEKDCANKKYVDENGGPDLEYWE